MLVHFQTMVWHTKVKFPSLHEFLMMCFYLLWNFLMHPQTHYFWPLDSTKIKEYETIWNANVKLSGGTVTSQTLPVMFGRYFYCMKSIKMHISTFIYNMSISLVFRSFEVFESSNGVARFTFEYLCGRPVSPGLYV